MFSKDKKGLFRGALKYILWTYQNVTEALSCTPPLYCSLDLEMDQGYSFPKNLCKVIPNIEMEQNLILITA